MIRQKIVDYLQPETCGLDVGSVRIGLGYTSVKLSNGNLGLAWTPQSNSSNCTHMPLAGTLAGKPSLELLSMLNSPDNALKRSLGLATANALIAGLAHPDSCKDDVLDIININSTDRVCMVGFFGPVISTIKLAGCKLDILELNKDKPNTIPEQDKAEALRSCTIAIITASSISTNTIDQLLSTLDKPRAVIILGPSTIMHPPVFDKTPVTHLAGSRVLNPDAVEQIVSEGGGTMILKKFLSFETICL